MVILLSATICSGADRKQSSWNKIPELRKAGYVELFGADAAHFLVGNSVLVQKSGPLDSEKHGIEISPRIEYFPSDHTMYECGVDKAADCGIRAWGFLNNQICLDVVCNGQSEITIMKSPETRRGGSIGVYVWFGHYVYEIVRGNRTNLPLFDNPVRSQPIELDSSTLDKEISEAGAGSKEVPIFGARAVSLLIGNTFLSDDAAKFSEDPAANACPKEGTYYSPDGKVIRFACRDGRWSVTVLHWKIRSGLFCRDGPDSQSVGSFNCTRAVISAIYASPSDHKLRIRDPKYPDSDTDLMGYVGNTLNFRFNQYQAAGTSGKERP